MGVAIFLSAAHGGRVGGVSAAIIGGGAAVQIIRDIAMLRRAVSALQQGGKSVALVPTMGALHEGHLSLVRMGKRVADHVIVSIFVNPTQFGPNEDFASYPRDEQRDAALLAQEGVALLWAPDVEVMYPAGPSTHIEVADVAIFGEKDWQQLAIIRRMARDLDFALDILGAPIARDSDGLALSSRNAYLSEQQRAAATSFPDALKAAVAAIAGGGDVAEALAAAEKSIVAGGFDSVERLGEFRTPARLLAAARIGKTRLIDNYPVG
jgi:pantoate--beta-alanine ligase